MADGAVEAKLLVVDDGVRAALVTLRLLEDEPMPVSGMNGRDVASVEQEFDCVLPDAVLAAFAANTDELGEQAEMSLDDVFAHTSDARRRGLRKNLVAIGRHPDGLVFYCIEHRTDWQDHPVALYVFDPADQSVGRETFDAWLAGRVEACRETLQEGTAEERARAAVEPNQAQLDGFRPVLLSGAGAHSPGPKTVRHKKFGTGTVLSETGEGMDRKLEVEFAEVGVKLILARFLEEL